MKLRSSFFTAVLFSILVIMLSACSKQTEVNVPPQPPDPFPIELSTGLSVVAVDVSKQSATIKLQATTRTNTTLREHVIVTFKQYVNRDNVQFHLQTNTLLDEENELYVKKQATEEIIYSEFGEYGIGINAYYGSFGQDDFYRVFFDEMGVRIEPDPYN